MLKAYHIIGLDVGDIARAHLHPPPPEVLTRARARYDAIGAAGVLRPEPRTGRLVEDNSRMYLEDWLAGDDRYVFLSLGPRYGFDSAATFGFVFDAEVLLTAGAILRDGDLLEAYEDALGDLIEDRTHPKPMEEWTTAEIAALFAALESDATDADYQSPHDAYHTLTDAVRCGDRAVPGVAEVLDAFRVQVAQLQATHQTTGAAALARALADRGTGAYEILVPSQLPLDQAVAVIVAGEELPV